MKQYLGGEALKFVADHKLCDRTTMQCVTNKANHHPK